MFVIRDDNRQWWILGAASCVLGLVVLDETVVGVALPTIRSDLSMSPVGSHWVVNAYLTAFTCFVAVGGRLGDAIGRRTLFIVGAAVFALGSVLAGSAPSGSWLIGSRALQGVGAAITFPASLAIITSAFPPDVRGSAFAIQTTIAGIFMASGPLVGGLFSEVISWRWIFWINLPIAAGIATILALAMKPGQGEPAATRFSSAAFDYYGLIALVLGLTALIIALMQSADWGWAAPETLILLAGGLALLVLFVIIELRRVDALIDLDLLRIRTFTGGSLVLAVFQFEKMIVFIFLSLYLQHRLDWSPIEAGLVITIAILPTLVTSRIAGRLRDSFGPRIPLTITLLLTGLAVIGIALAAAYRSQAAIMVVLIFWGAIMPAIAVCARSALLSAVPQSRQGQAGGVNLTIQMLGGTFGIGICSALLGVTGSYWLVFLLTGCAVLGSATISWLFVDRPSRPQE